MTARYLKGWTDIVQVLAVAAAVAFITSFLMDHLRVRRELFDVAHERSMTAFREREVREDTRHLLLEERIREASVRREEAPSAYQAPKGHQLIVLPDPVVSPPPHAGLERIERELVGEGDE